MKVKVDSFRMSSSCESGSVYELQTSKQTKSFIYLQSLTTTQSHRILLIWYQGPSMTVWLYWTICPSATGSLWPKKKPGQITRSSLKNLILPSGLPCSSQSSCHYYLAIKQIRSQDLHLVLQDFLSRPSSSNWEWSRFCFSGPRIYHDCLIYGVSSKSWRSNDGGKKRVEVAHLDSILVGSNPFKLCCHISRLQLRFV